MSTGGETYLRALGIVSALGCGKDEVRRNLFEGNRPGVVPRDALMVDGSSVYAGAVVGPLPPGEYRVVVSNHDGVSSEQSVRLRGQERETLQMQLGGEDE